MMTTEEAYGQWTEPDMAALAEHIAARTGLVFPPSRRESAEAAIRRAMARAELSDASRYRALIESDDATFDALVAELTVGETHFLRESEQLAFIAREVVPELRRRRGAAHVLRAWSAGCSSGEEPYSVAMLLHESEPEGAPYILGTDLSRARLALARRARYGRWSLRGVPEAVVRRYFVQRANQFELVPAIRSAVDFRYMNLAESAWPNPRVGTHGMDLVLCRNVLIYFDGETIARVVHRLLDALGEGGWLFLGASDPPITDVAGCETVVTGAGVAYRRTSRPRRSVPERPCVVPAPPERRGSGDGGAEPALAVAPAQPLTPLPAPNGAPLSPHPTRRETTAVLLAEAAGRYAERDYSGAAELAERYATDDGGDPMGWVVLVRSYANLGLLAEAGRACAAALDRHRACAELVYLHAVLLTEAARHRDAAAAARRALYLDRELIVAHLALGDALARQGDTGGARRAFRNAERLSAALPPAAAVPASDGDSAGRLCALARTRLRLLNGTPV